MQKAVLISRGTCWRKGLAFALCSPLSFTIIMGPSFQEGRICRYVSWSYSEREIGMLFDSERYSVYIGFAGIALSVGGVNQYCLLRWPVPVHFMISEAPVYTVAQKLYVSVWYHQPGAWAEVSEFLGVASLRSGMWWREAPYTLLYICRRWLCRSV